MDNERYELLIELLRSITSVLVLIGCHFKRKKHPEKQIEKHIYLVNPNHLSPRRLIKNRINKKRF